MKRQKRYTTRSSEVVPSVGCNKGQQDALPPVGCSRPSTLGRTEFAILGIGCGEWALYFNPGVAPYLHMVAGSASGGLAELGFARVACEGCPFGGAVAGSPGET